MSRIIPDYRDKRGREEYWGKVDASLDNAVFDESILSIIPGIFIMAMIFVICILFILIPIAFPPEPTVWTYDDGVSITYHPDYAHYAIDFVNPNNDTHTVTVTVNLAENEDVRPLLVRSATTFPAHFTYSPYDPAVTYQFTIDVEKNDGELRRYVKTFTYDGEMVLTTTSPKSNNGFLDTFK